MTSRERLAVPGEHAHVVVPLDGFESVDLFCERARDADDSFEGDDEDREVVQTICARLDGLPLAIEIAAARTRVMTTRDLLGQLEDLFARRPSAGVGISRHATLHAAIDWSYQLLGATERDVFVCAAVFAGGFDLAAISAVSDVVVPAGTNAARLRSCATAMSPTTRASPDRSDRSESRMSALRSRCWSGSGTTCAPRCPGPWRTTRLTTRRASPSGRRCR